MNTTRKRPVVAILAILLLAVVGGATFFAGRVESSRRSNPAAVHYGPAAVVETTIWGRRTLPQLPTSAAGQKTWVLDMTDATGRHLGSIRMGRYVSGGVQMVFIAAVKNGLTETQLRVPWAGNGLYSDEAGRQVLVFLPNED